MSPAADARAFSRPQQALLGVVVLATLFAGFAHASVAPEHFGEAALYGTFFAVLATAQFAYAVVIAGRPSRRLLLAGAIVQLGIVALWAYTRTVGIPLGPRAGEVEAVGGIDVACAALEIAAAIAALGLAARFSGRAPASRAFGRTPRPAR